MIQSPTTASNASSDRSYWLDVLERLAQPVLENLAQHTLKKNMPVEAAEAADPADRAKFTHLEAIGRLLAGIAPWLEAQGGTADELTRQHRISQLARASLDAATTPNSPDFMNFNYGHQPLVDAAFLAQGILRAPTALWAALDARVQRQVVQALLCTRAIRTPTHNNWVLFAAMIETALLTMGQPTIEERLEGCLRSMLGWYAGDGAYGDGEFFHWDYYNSFVIHPMLLDVLTVLRHKDKKFATLYALELERSRRYAAILERLIAPDGTIPALGRSITYRMGTMQTLAHMSLLRELPAPVQPAQVRGALTAVMRRMMEAPGTFDAHGWLRIGFCGHQRSLAEVYISTGSLYLCSTVLLPLGLPPTDIFWREPATPWTAQQLWAGQSLPADHALSPDEKTAPDVLVV